MTNGRSFSPTARAAGGRGKLARRRPRDTRAAVLEAAYTLFLHQGYHGTSMRQIAGRARLTPAGIYNHFRGKEAIFLTLLGERVPQRALARAMAAAEGETVEQLIHDAMARMSHAMADQYDNLRLLFIELLEFQGRHARHIAKEFLPQALNFVERLQQAEGRLKPVDPMMIARAFLGLFMSYAITVTFFPKLPGFTTQATDLEELSEILLRGILQSPGEGVTTRAETPSSNVEPLRQPGP
jgi:AcrR family transcriptional regulator